MGSMDGTTSTLENTTTTERGPGPSPMTKRTGTSSSERSLLRINLCWMVRDGATSSLTPGPPPYTMVWFSKPVARLVPITRDFVGQDELTVSAWHTPGKELKFETNLPEFRTMKITSAGPTKTFFFNGEEKATVDFDSSSKKASHTMHLPSGKDLTIDLAWPKMTADASDLEFGVTITPDRKVVTKFGWEWAGVKKVYLDVVGNNPWIGDYKLSRQGEFEEVSGSLYKMKWTGHGETTKGFFRRVSPVETNVVASVNTRNLNVDAIVWKSFAGQKYGFTMNNDEFTLLAGKH